MDGKIRAEQTPKMDRCAFKHELSIMSLLDEAITGHVLSSHLLVFSLYLCDLSVVRTDEG